MWYPLQLPPREQPLSQPPPPNKESLLTQGKRLHVQSCDANCVVILLTESQMWELKQIVAPKMKAHWSDLAYCMRYTAGEVKAFKKDSHDLEECCEKLFADWLESSHGPTPKTYETLLKHIKKIDKLTAVSEEIEKELVKGKVYIAC